MRMLAQPLNSYHAAFSCPVFTNSGRARHSVINRSAYSICACTRHTLRVACRATTASAVRSGPAQGKCSITVQQLCDLVQTGVDKTSSAQHSTLTAEAVAARLGVSLASGITGDFDDIAFRQQAYGCNRLPDSESSSLWDLVVEAASDFTLLLLMASGAVSLGLSAAMGKELADWIDGLAILASVAICVSVTAVTNYQKEAKFRQLNAIKDDVQVGNRSCNGRCITCTL